ncbi:MAG: lipopolysaccharide transport periplasmic protein LptA [Burkholderiaceae bacterium]
MPEPVLTLKLRIALLGMIAALACTTAWAEKADRLKPMNIESDTLRYDDSKQTSVFAGRVVLTKGTIVMRGARIDIRQDPDGSQYGLITAEPGKRAFFRQKREGLDEFTEGEAETIEYDGKGDRVKFTKRAELRRYRGATLNDEITGSLIVYDNATEVFSVDGGSPVNTPFAAGTVTPSGAPVANGRVRAILTPKPSASEPLPEPAASTPAQLRSSPGLSGSKN